MPTSYEAAGQAAGLRQWRDLRFLSWPLIVAAAVFLRALVDGMALFNDPDTYLHIAAGRWMIAHGALPFHDPFSHSMAGAAWVPHEWLAEIILASVYEGFGWGGLILLTATSFAVGLALLTRRLLRHFEAFSVLILVALSTASLLPHLLARPHILALPPLVVWCAALIAARDDGRAPPMATLPVMTLWANLHGSFMFGLALAVFLGIEAVIEANSPEGRRQAMHRWGGFVVLATLAALLTPNGFQGLLLPFRLSSMTTLQTSFGEWRSPDFQTFEPLEIWLLGAVLAGYALGLKLPIMRLALLLTLFHMALAHSRHIDLVAVVAPLAVAGSLGPRLAARIHATPPSVLGRGVAALATPASTAGVALVTALLLVTGVVALWRPVERPDGPVTPGAALSAAARLGLSGPVFNHEAFGGYLAFKGVPTFIDGRIEMYGDSFLRRDIEAEAGKEPALTQVLDRYGITWTLLSPTDSGAVEVLDHRPGWRRVYTDRHAVIHVRVAPGAR
jgi:hypothetical protein